VTHSHDTFSLSLSLSVSRSLSVTYKLYLALSFHTLSPSFFLLFQSLHNIITHLPKRVAKGIAQSSSRHLRSYTHTRTNVRARAHTHTHTYTHIHTHKWCTHTRPHVHTTNTSHAQSQEKAYVLNVNNGYRNIYMDGHQHAQKHTHTGPGHLREACRTVSN